MDRVYVIREGDECLSKESLINKGIFDDFGIAVETVIADIRKHNDESELRRLNLDEDKLRKQLDEDQQTHGLTVNYSIDAVPLNVLEEF